MTLANASISSKKRAEEPMGVVNLSTSHERKTNIANLQKAGKNGEVSSRYMPVSASRLSSQCSLDFCSTSSNSPKKTASLLPPHRSSFQSDGKAAGFKQSPLDRSSTALDAPNRSKSTERRRSHVKADALSSSSSLDCSPTTKSIPKRAISTERLRTSRTEIKSAANSCKPASSSPSRRVWQSSNGMFSSLQAESALSLSNARIVRDPTLRPAAAAANGVVHRLGNSVQTKKISETKSTPQRKDTAIRWPSTDQAENARPSDSLLHVRPVCKRWPGASTAKITRSTMSRSMDLSSEKVVSPASFAATLLIQDHKVNSSHKDSAAATSRSFCSSSAEVAPAPVPRPSRWSSPDSKGSSRQEHTLFPHKLQKDLLRQDNLGRRIGVEAQLASSVSPSSQNLSKANIVSSTDLKTVTSVKSTAAASVKPISPLPSSGLIQDATRQTFQTSNQHSCEKQSFSAEICEYNQPHHARVAGSDTKSSSNRRERPPNTSLAISPGHSQPPSPSASQRLLSMSPQEKCVGLASPSRSGFSPGRTRLPALSLTSSTPCRQGSMNNGSDISNVRRVTINQLEEAYMLRLLHNRLLQWHFVNARAEAAVNTQKAVAEKVLFNVGLKTFDLQMTVAMRRIKFQKAKQIQKLDMFLLAQEGQLEGWESIQQEHLAALEAFTKALEAATIKIPSTGNARADVRAIREAFATVLDAMHSMESPVRSLSPKLEKMNILLEEMAKVLAIEMALIYNSKNLLSKLASLQREEHSLKAHIMQISLEKEKPDS